MPDRCPSSIAPGRRCAVRLLGALLLATAGASARTAGAEVGDLVRSIDGGQVRGLALDAQVAAWYALPYAAAPVGERRWRPPAPVVPWSGVREAIRRGAPCVQPYSDATHALALVGSEDCLTLNVYAPRGPGRARPVVFFIHGGGQMYGTGATYDGAELARRHDLVVVTINYRLGVLGWFHHPAITGRGAGRATGQFALLDMIQALRWVRRNIATFGGDPHNVTIAGESAGAQNVYALLLAPPARGLYARAIAESGGFWNMSLAQAVNYADEPEPGTPLSAREVTRALLLAAGRAADAAGARRLEQREPGPRLAHWLRALPLQDVFAPFLASAHADYDLPSVVYDGVLLPRAGHRAAFGQGRYAHVPLLIGGNRDEQKLYLYTDPEFVRNDGGVLSVRDPQRYETFNHLYSAWWNFMAVDDLLERIATPVYAYSFDWSDEPRTPSDLHTLYGAAHGLELAFVFGDFRAEFVHDELPGYAGGPDPNDPLAALFGEANRDSREHVSAAMISYWAEFARTGRPGRGTQGTLPDWGPWRQTHARLVFDEQPVRLRPGRWDGDTLLGEIWSAPGLSHAQRCAAFRDATMYPSYPLARLAEHGCAR